MDQKLVTQAAAAVGGVVAAAALLEGPSFLQGSWSATRAALRGTSGGGPSPGGSLQVITASTSLGLSSAAVVATSLAAVARASRRPARKAGVGMHSFDPANEVGVTELLGFFDPAGFCKNTDLSGFRNLRAAEIKHGRVAMMAALGALVQHYVRIPGFESMPSGLHAVLTPPGSYGFAALLAVAAALELGPWTESYDKEPGDFGDPLNLGQYTEDMRNKELNNGRAAMFAAVGIIAAEWYTSLDGVEQLTLAPVVYAVYGLLLLSPLVVVVQK
ncbi:unnamed protein product [Polarella glacialis]|uniref:Uncharacterized protein n=1 Tax=Polarella glacialis TaxID=89957 RepID=A0A813JMT1_POLGL|nr:unnamed protein product [Polarella glacialis]